MARILALVRYVVAQSRSSSVCIVRCHPSGGPPPSLTNTHARADVSNSGDPARSATGVGRLEVVEGPGVELADLVDLVVGDVVDRLGEDLAAVGPVRVV